MNFAQWIRGACAGSGADEPLPEAEAARLFGAMLDGGVPELELGALLVALAVRGVAPSEMMGFARAVSERTQRLALADTGLRPVVLASLTGTRAHPNLVPLVALMVRKFGVPVLVHGTLEGDGGTIAAPVLRELQVPLAASLTQASSALAEQRIAFVPTALLCPGLAALASLRSRLGIATSAHTLARVLDPFDCGALIVAGASDAGERALLRDLLLEGGCSALLLDATEGEPFANPERRPRIELLVEGEARVLFESEGRALRGLPGLPRGEDVRGTAQWIGRAVRGEVPLPLPVANQIACCLYAAGYTDDMNQAKAIMAVEGAGFAAA